MTIYKTSEVASIIGVHPNTVRLYEEWGLISKPERLENGYRIFTDLHIRQMQLARIAFQIELLQNGLRKKIVETVKTVATGDYIGAIRLTNEYINMIDKECFNAEDAIKIVQNILHGEETINTVSMKRKEVSKYLGISTELGNEWSINGKTQRKWLSNLHR